MQGHICVYVHKYMCQTYIYEYIFWYAHTCQPAYIYIDKYIHSYMHVSQDE